MKKINPLFLLLLLATVYSWNLQHANTCQHFLFNSTTLSFVCDQTLYQYDLSSISSTSPSAASPPISRQYALSHNFQTIIHISDTHILGSKKACTSFRLTYTFCNPFTLTTINGLSSEITAPNWIWFDQVQFDYPYLFLFDIQTYELDVQDVQQQTQVSKATATFQGNSFRLQVSRISPDINLILLYHAKKANQVYEFNRSSQTLTPVFSFENPLSGFVADAEMYGRYIVYIHFSLIMVFRHGEHGETEFSCELLEKQQSKRFTADFKKRVYFTQQSDLVFASFAYNDFIYVVTISKATGSCFVKGYQFKDQRLAFGYFKDNYVYAFYEFNGEVAREREDEYSYFLEREHSFEFEAWMIVLIVVPLVIIVVVIMVVCAIIKRRNKLSRVQTTERSERYRKKGPEKVVKLEIEQQL